MDVESVIQRERSQKKKNKYWILTYICGIEKNGIDDLICKAEMKTQMYGTKGESVRVGGIGILGLTHTHYW